MAVILPEPKTLARRTEFTLLVPGGRIAGKARFVREERIKLAGADLFRYGLEFIDLAEEDRARIRELGRYAIEEESRT